MNQTKRICIFLLGFVLTLGMAFRLSIGEVFAENAEQVGESTAASVETEATAAETAVETSAETTVVPETETAVVTETETAVETTVGTNVEAETTSAAETEVIPDEYIYFDLAAGNVNITAATYSGAVYVGGVKTTVSGTHAKTNRYYVYQSNLTGDPAANSYYKNTGYVNTDDKENKRNCRVPEYTRVSYGGDSWSDYITNNTDVYAVSENWDTAAAAVGRTSTANYVLISQSSDFDVTVDNIWSTYTQISTGRQAGGIAVRFNNVENANLQLRMKGDNRVNNIHYYAALNQNNKMVFSNADTNSVPGSITAVTYKNYKGNGKTIWSGNYWNSAIGGSDSIDQSDGMVVDSGVIYAGTTWEDNATAFGGGGNGFGGVTINKGIVTAVAATTGTAIGGGIGWSDLGGNAKVTINGGTVYAYNLGVDSSKSPNIYSRHVPAAAIGGGSSEKNNGNTSTIVTINGGNVYAQSTGGAAIGGGGSATKNGGGATININGGKIIAKSITGTYSGAPVDAGVSIGGGTGNINGGSVNLNINGGTLRTGSIGGGKSTGGGTLGYAKVAVTGGDIVGQVIMEATGAEGLTCSFTMTDGVIHDSDVINGYTVTDLNDPTDIPIQFLEHDGGAVWMHDPYGVTDISGGTIRDCFAQTGGAVYMTGGSCKIGGTASIIGNAALENGGGVYVGGGEVTVEGGSVSGNKADKSGGAVYMTDGLCKIGGTASVNGNAALENGGGVYLGGGEVTVEGGSVSGNKADKSGGAVYMSGGSFKLSGTASVNGNTALENGGGVYVGGGEVTVEGGSVSGNKTDKNGGGLYVGSGKVLVTGGAINNNTAAQNGGGAYVGGVYTMIDGEVMYNTAINGGGLYINDNVVTVCGGRIDSNTASECGGGMYVSSVLKDAIVDIVSGSVSSNRAKTGAGVAVISDSETHIDVTVGVNCEHPGLDRETGAFTAFPYPSAPAEWGANHEGHTNHYDGLVHMSCPRIENNVASVSGGGFFLKSMKTELVFYCVTESGNISQQKKSCNGMEVQGGHVEVGDKTYDPSQPAHAKGNILMQSSVLVEGGTVDIYGEMDNPKFTDDVTVDVKVNSDYYVDHRLIVDPDLKDYKVHYYENFKGEGDTPTGLYIARQYPDLEHENAEGNEKFDFTVMSSIFYHPGYKIVCWNTKPDNTGIEYDVNATYNLKELETMGRLGVTNLSGEYDNSLLVIYAIWERCGYVIKFDPNVGEGETYSGIMENQRVTVGILDGSQSLNPNRFKRPGWKFIGWTLVPSPTASDRVYEDGYVIREDFTGVDGAVVTLYAQWAPCDHIHYLVYTAEGNVLTETCSMCGAHTAKATISAVDSIYDGNYHLATVSYSENWLGSKSDISYDMAVSSWDTEDTVDDNWASDPKPLHAGNYTASLTVGGAAAKTEYTISPIKWATPSVPQIAFEIDPSTGKSMIVISQPTDYNILYRIRVLKNGVETPVEGYADWQSDNRFFDIPFAFYYYFYAKRSADRDHLESTPSQSEAYLAIGGNIVFIKSDTGIKVDPIIGDGRFDYIVGADDGYHLRDYADNMATAISEAHEIPGSTGAFLNPNGIQLEKVKNDDGTYKYTVKFVENQVAFYQLTLEFSGAVKNASVSHKVTDGEVFSDFNGKVTTISRDSAFTAQFTVNDYIPDEYTEQVLSFSKALPVGTTIIMKAVGEYWYYNLNAAAMSAFNLNDFTAMGGTGKFEFNTTDTAAKAFTYQFIVDFSKVTGNTMLGSLEVCLGLTANPSRSAPTISPLNSKQVSLGVVEEAAFSLAPKDISGKSAALNCTYNASVGDASIWNGRDTALVLTAPLTAPADLTMTVVVDGYITLYAMNANRQFVIPLGEIGSKEVKITLNSHMLGLSEKNLEFTAEWYVSRSNADMSPLNGYLAASCKVTFQCKKDSVPSVRIDGDKRLYHAGDILRVTVYYAGLPNDGIIVDALEYKNEGNYIGTGAKPSLAEDDGNGVRHVEFNIGQMESGSYRVLISIQQEGANILQVPYYFVIA